MNLRLTPRQEIFCRLVVEGTPVAQAYYRAGFDGTSEKASKLHRNPRIQKRLRDLQRRQLIRHDITMDTILLELEEARVFAKRCMQTAAMVSATVAKAKLLGMFVQRVEGTVEVVHSVDMSKLSNEELETLRKAAVRLVEDTPIHPQRLIGVEAG